MKGGGGGGREGRLPDLRLWGGSEMLLWGPSVGSPTGPEDLTVGFVFSPPTVAINIATV